MHGKGLQRDPKPADSSVLWLVVRETGEGELFAFQFHVVEYFTRSICCFHLERRYPNRSPIIPLQFLESTSPSRKAWLPRLKAPNATRPPSLAPS